MNQAHVANHTSPSENRVEKIGVVIRMLASAMLGAQETRIVRFNSVREGKVRWQVEVEAFVPNPELTIINHGQTRGILERRHCRFDLDEHLELVAFAPVDIP
ncbi:MAG: hypothetical protein ACYC0C_03760 [Devosia sp.]